MNSKGFKARIVVVALIVGMVLSGCASKDLLENVTKVMNEAQEVLEENTDVAETVMEEVDNLADSNTEDENFIDNSEEVSEDNSEEVSAGRLAQATFLIGDLGVYVSLAETFIEKEELNLSYVEGKGYLLVEGTITNNGKEETTLAMDVYVVGIDDCGNQIGNANSWIDATGLATKIQPGETINFNELYLYNSEAKKITFKYDPDIEELNSFYYYVDISDVSNEAETIESENEEEMFDILLNTSNTILDAIENHRYENIAEFGYYTFLSPSLDMDSSNAVWFEAYNWEACNENEEVCDFGIDFDGNQVNITYAEYFDQYIAAYDFLQGNVLIKQERLPYFPERPDSQVTHYVRYEDSGHFLYFLYEETYFNEFALTGIAVGIE